MRYDWQVGLGTVTLGVWRRFSEFKRLARKLGRSSRREQFHNALCSWRCLTERQRWFRYDSKDHERELIFVVFVVLVFRFFVFSIFRLFDFYDVRFFLFSMVRLINFSNLSIFTISRFLAFLFAAFLYCAVRPGPKM